MEIPKKHEEEMTMEKLTKMVLKQGSRRTYARYREETLKKRNGAGQKTPAGVQPLS